MGDDLAPPAELLTAQVRLADDPAFRLDIARALVGAKLDNYAALSDAYPDREGREPIGPALRALAARAEGAATLESLLGFEGAGAARWYQTLDGRLPARFYFRVRVAPTANDPINVMLNIAQTHLYRQARIAARLTGLHPSIGFLHRPQPGFSPLAADLQEPFRPLMDRAVIETAHKVQPRDFRRDGVGPYPLIMEYSARRRLLASIHETLGLACVSSHNDDLVSYQTHIARLARAIRRAVLSGDGTIRVFRYPPAARPSGT